MTGASPQNFTPYYTLFINMVVESMYILSIGSLCVTKRLIWWSGLFIISGLRLWMSLNHPLYV